MVVVIFLLMISCAFTGCSWHSKDDRGNVNVSQGVNTLERTIKQSIQRSGGNFNGQNVHLIIGLFTGSFDQDPQVADATREMACQLAFKVLRPGDRLSIVPWEMDVWQPDSRADLTREFTSRDKEKPVDIYGMLPLTQKSGSQGGHDTERAITSILRQYGTETNAVVVLLANNASSMAGYDGSRPVGESNRAYRRALNGWRRERAVNSTNASAQLSFVHAKSEPRQMDAVVLVPDQFSGPELSPERPQQPAYSDPRVQRNWSGLWMALGWLVGLALLAVLLWWLWKNEYWPFGKPVPPKTPYDVTVSVGDDKAAIVALAPTEEWTKDMVLCSIYAGSLRTCEKQKPCLYIRDTGFPENPYLLAEIVAIGSGRLQIRPNKDMMKSQLHPDTKSMACEWIKCVTFANDGIKQGAVNALLNKLPASLPTMVKLKLMGSHKFTGQPLTTKLDSMIQITIDTVK